MKRNKEIRSISFLVGLFASYRVHVVGMIGVSELLLNLIAPFVLMKDIGTLRNTKCMTFVVLAALYCFGAIFSGFANNTPFSAIMRGFATPYTLLSATIVIRHLLARDMGALKWCVIGLTMSGLFSYILNGGDISALSDNDATIGMNSAATVKMYLSKPFFLAPIKCWYSQLPWLLSSCIALFFALFSILITDSGRSTALVGFAATGIILLCRKRVDKIRGIGKNFGFYLVISVIGIFALKWSYSQAAVNGLLGEKARVKYEAQTRGDTSMVKLLIGGRADSFVGLLACFDRPITGVGPWALDTKGYVYEFFSKYGQQEDFDRLQSSAATRRSMGYFGDPLIPVHSHIVGAWAWCSIFGLFFWVYVLFMIAELIRKSFSVVLPWTGFFIVMIPSVLWDVFFSPLGERVQMALFLAAILCVRGVKCCAIYPGEDIIKESLRFTKR